LICPGNIFPNLWGCVIEALDSVVEIGIGTFDYIILLPQLEKSNKDLTFAFCKENAYNTGGHTASPLPLRVFQLFLPVAASCLASRVLSSFAGV
jgi:hypothetical protein